MSYIRSDSNLNHSATPGALLSISDFRRLARHRGVHFSPAHTTRLAREGKTQAAKIGNRWYIDPEEAERYLTPRQFRPRQPIPPTTRQQTRRARAAAARIQAMTLPKGGPHANG